MCQTRIITYTCTHPATFCLSRCNGTLIRPGTRPVREERKPCCYADDPLTLHSPRECGLCSREAVMRGLEARVRALLAKSAAGHAWGSEGVAGGEGWDGDEEEEEEEEELEQAREARDRMLYVVGQQFPDTTFKKWGRPERGGDSDLRACRSVSKGEEVVREVRASVLVAASDAVGQSRKGSILKEEVLPEDVIIVEEPKKTPPTWAAEFGWADASTGWLRLEDEIADQAAREAAGITVSFSPWAGQKDPEAGLVYRSFDAKNAVERNTASPQPLNQVPQPDGRSDDDDAMDKENHDFRVSTSAPPPPKPQTKRMPAQDSEREVDEKLDRLTSYGESDPPSDFRIYDTIMLAVH